MIVKYCYFIGLCLFTLQGLFGQQVPKLSLGEAYELLEGRYPALQNSGVLDEIYQKELEKLDKSRLPSIYLKGEGRLQSESVRLEVPEGVNLPFEIDQPLYSARAYMEAQYSILDGGFTNAQRKLKEVQLQVDKQSIEVDRYSLRERLNQLFISVLMLRRQATLFDLSLQNLAARKEAISAGVEFGLMLESELQKIEVKELELKAQSANINYKITGLINTLNQLLGTQLSKEAELEFPTMAAPNQIPTLDRPEQTLFQLQQESILANEMLIDASRRPKLGAYAQGGVGYPNPLNFIDNSTAPFGVVGLQFSWQITDWKKSKLDKQILNLQAQKLQHAEASFEFNMESKEANYLADVDRLQNQIEQDGEIAALQGKILQQMAAQLDEGVITSSEYITQVNSELIARQNLLIHQTELLKTQLEFWNERGGK